MSASPAFLKTLSEPDLAALSGRWSVRSYRRHEFVIAHGDTRRDVFFVLDGQARVTIFSANGREVAYGDLNPGDIFGELAAIDGKPRSASVVAMEPLRAASLSAPAFEALLGTHPSIGLALLKHFSLQLRRMTDRVFEYSTLVVRERVICELLRRADEAGRLEGAATIIPMPTHSELASAISTHREAVSREMSDLAKRGLIARRGASLVLKDRVTLEALSGRD